MPQHEEEEEQSPVFSDPFSHRLSGYPIVSGDCIKWGADGTIAVVNSTEIHLYQFCPASNRNRYQQFSAAPCSIREDRSLSFMNQHTIRIGGEKPQEMLSNFQLSKAKSTLATMKSAQRPPSSDQPIESDALLYRMQFQKKRKVTQFEEACFSRTKEGFFVAAVFGPAGSGINNSCALLTLSSTHCLRIFFPPTDKSKFQWTESFVFSEIFFQFLLSRNKKRGRLNKVVPLVSNFGLLSMEEFIEKNNSAAILTVSWCTNYSDDSDCNSKVDHSFILLAGRGSASVWKYSHASINAEQKIIPVAFNETNDLGWITSCCFAKNKGQSTLSNTVRTPKVVLGTVGGNIYLCSINPNCPETKDCGTLLFLNSVCSPYTQPIYHLITAEFGAVIFASGSSISIWDHQCDSSSPTCNTDQTSTFAALKSWNAHVDTITGIDINASGSVLFTACMDGTVKTWSMDSGERKLLLEYSNLSENKHSLFGICVSPNSVQVACLGVSPAVSTSTRSTQSDISHNYPSSKIICFPSPNSMSAIVFSETVCGAICNTEDIYCSKRSFSDITWFLYRDSLLRKIHSFKRRIIGKLNSQKSGMDRPIANRIKTDHNESVSKSYFLHVFGKLITLFEQKQDKYEIGLDLEHMISFLQKAYLLRQNMIDSSMLAPKFDDSKMEHKIISRILFFWAEKYLVYLFSVCEHESHFKEINVSQVKSCLIMADFVLLHFQQRNCKSKSTLNALLFVYETFSSSNQAFIDEVKGLLNKSAIEFESVDIHFPPRDYCPVCQSALLNELEIDGKLNPLFLKCENGHVLNRCFLSFQVINPLFGHVYQCLGCNSMARLCDQQHPLYNFPTFCDRSSFNFSVADMMCLICGERCIPAELKASNDIT